jgi:hypothetical protein
VVQNYFRKSVERRVQTRQGEGLQLSTDVGLSKIQSTNAMNDRAKLIGSGRLLSPCLASSSHSHLSHLDKRSTNTQTSEIKVGFIAYFNDFKSVSGAYVPRVAEINVLAQAGVKVTVSDVQALCQFPCMSLTASNILSDRFCISHHASATTDSFHDSFTNHSPTRQATC